MQDTCYFTVLRGRPPAPLVSPKASGNHLSDAVRSMLLRDPSLLRPQVPVGPYRRPRCFGSRVPPALPRERCPRPTRQEPEPRMHGPREGPGPSGGLPRWPAGGSPKCHTVVQRSHFGGHFGTPLGGELAHSYTKSSKMGVQKVVKTGPLGRVLGELGCLLFLLRVFKTNLL